MACHDYIESLVKLTDDEIEDLGIPKAHDWYEVTAFDPDAYYCHYTFSTFLYLHPAMNYKPNDKITMRFAKDRMFVANIRKFGRRGLYNYEWDFYTLKIKLIDLYMYSDSCRCGGESVVHYHIEPKPYLVSYLLCYAMGHNLKYLDIGSGMIINNMRGLFELDEIVNVDAGIGIEEALYQCNDVEEFYYDYNTEVDFESEKTMNAIHLMKEVIVRHF